MTTTNLGSSHQPQAQVCENCKSNELETDPVKGIVYCGDCGMIQEENMMVNTLQFASEGSKTALQGQIVNIENANIGTKYIDSFYYIKNTITNICSKLTLDSNHIDVAFRWYKLSLQHNITKGKSILYTLSACIYISCRQASTPHLLIDFSNSLRIDVFKIGKVFLKMRSLFKLDIRQIDPTLYMHRFITQLKLKNPEILSVSMRLLDRMKKDWIVEGRRPNNSCGAAILVASRVCNEPVTIGAVARIVHASKATITRRISELANTESADLSLEEFKNIWIDEEEAPPVSKAAVKAQNIKSVTPVKKYEDEEEEETVFDEDEYILNPSEVINKTKLWEGMYKEEEDLALKKKMSKAVTHKTSSTKHRKKYNFKTVEDALEALDKKVTNKLNFTALEKLFEDD